MQKKKTEAYYASVVKKKMMKKKGSKHGIVEKILESVVCFVEQTFLKTKICSLQLERIAGSH